jgi:hypothetical protein
MNIGIDIDGTLNKYPEFFRWLIDLTRKDGGRVYLITGLGRSGVPKRLDRLIEKGFDFTDVEVINTSLYNGDERALIGKVENNEEIVGRFKQRMCVELDVDFMFDDMASIHRQFGDIPIFEVK